MTKPHWFLYLTPTFTFVLLAAGKQCPTEFPFAYHDGDFCCAKSVEKNCKSEGCNGGNLTKISRCCGGDEFIPCMEKPCESNLLQCPHPFKNKVPAKVELGCADPKKIILEKNTRYVFKSTNYPMAYPLSFTYCDWTLKLPKEGIVFECPKFSVGAPDDKNCSKDYVLFVQGEDKFCGKHDGVKKTIKRDLDHLIVAFITSDGSQHPGFYCEAYLNDDKKEPCFSPDDPHSFSRPDEARVTDMHLELFVDFQAQILNGSVTLTVEKVQPNVNQLVLDARYLEIQDVTDAKTNMALDFQYGTESYVGAKLEITLPPQDPAPKVKVWYKTTEKSSALQWLKPEQTLNKNHPILFTESKFINARSMVPCQDTPSNKANYSAKITVPNPHYAYMSALRQEYKPGNIIGTGDFQLIQKNPIPSYLIALVVGHLYITSIGKRSKVRSERKVLGAAYQEFKNYEILLDKAEEICGPYVWGTYEILVLPPLYANDGLENPSLTYASPNLLVGDQSLVHLLARDIAHSWSGNLVTNKNWEHYWLNGGLTRFIERKIIGADGGEPSRHLEAIRGWRLLEQDIDRLKKDNPLTALVPDLEGVDPADAISVVHYEKGHTFLWYLEDLVGGPSVFHPFLKAYFKAFKFKSIDSYDFKGFFVNHFKNITAIKKVNWDGWFKNPGMPPYKPNFDTSLAEACQNLTARWVSYDKTGIQGDFKMEDIKDFTTMQKVEFLDLLLEEQPIKFQTFIKMNQLYQFANDPNLEILTRWRRMGIQGRYSVQNAYDLLAKQRQLKFLIPMYRVLNEWEGTGRQSALAIFKANKDKLMDVAVKAVQKILKLA